MTRNENWAAISDKEPGDEIQLVLSDAGYGRENERLGIGRVGKVTSSTRYFTMDGAVRDGLIRFGSNMRNPSETEGLIVLDGQRTRFTIATASEIARLTDPNRALREDAEDALRDLRWGARRVSDMDKSGAASLLSELETALGAVKRLHDAL